jgi:hypothetical protein
LVKYTYLYNVPTTDQLAYESAGRFIQKTHVAAVTYGRRRRALVVGSTRTTATVCDDPQFFVRRFSAPLPVLDELGGMVGGGVSRAGDPRRRRQPLVAISRYLNKHLKVGVGYNFTDFSDDLTDLSYDSRGVFVSMTGVL